MAPAQLDAPYRRRSMSMRWWSLPEANVVGALLLLLAPAVNATDQDHRLITRYPGSTVLKHDAKDFDRYRLVVGLEPKGMKFKAEEVQGTTTRIVYENPAERSTVEIFRNYRQALERADAEMLFSCEIDACGPAYARGRWNRENGLFTATDGDPRYLAARVGEGDATAYVAVMVGKARTQLDIVETKVMDEGLIAVDPSALARTIEAVGSVRIYGIHFDVDKADIRPESTQTLEAIAQLLRTKPELSLFVVGHTDTTGALEHNLKLSDARARAVVAALTDRYGIAGTRLDAHGVGPLAPVAPNTTEAGRQQNRRVELVAR
jgi:outer membrane protein OmpA-like peptidoglycan-associated protein